MSEPTMQERAETLLSNTKKLRFFKGQVYDGGADEYLRQLHGFLADFLSQQIPPDNKCPSCGRGVTVGMVHRCGPELP